MIIRQEFLVYVFTLTCTQLPAPSRLHINMLSLVFQTFEHCENIRYTFLKATQIVSIIIIEKRMTHTIDAQTFDSDIIDQK